MIAKIEEKKPDAPKPLPFPKLMKSLNSGTVVLFRKPEVGQVVAPSGFHSFETATDGWEMSNFQDLPTNQQVVLSN